jgi:hypothetical protein
MERSDWVALRFAVRRADTSSTARGHASPVFVTVTGKSVASKKDAAFFVAWIDHLIRLDGPA